MHLYRVYFADVADAQQVYADSPESAAAYVRRNRKPGCECEPVVRYEISVTRMDARIPLVMEGFEVR